MTPEQEQIVDGLAARYLTESAGRRWEARNRLIDVLREAGSSQDASAAVADESLRRVAGNGHAVNDQGDQAGTPSPPVATREGIPMTQQTPSGYPGDQDGNREPGQAAPPPDGIEGPLTSPLQSDRHLADAASAEALRWHCWAGGLGWLRYESRTGTWAGVPEEAVIEEVGRYVLGKREACLSLALEDVQAGGTGKFWSDTADAWLGKASASRITAVARLTRGIRLADPARFDASPDLLNVANGVLDLRTLELRPHDPELYFTRCAGADWQPGARHPDIDKALAAIPDDAREYAQLRYGQAITGHKPPDDVIVVQQGSGENGKTSLVTAALRALGDYAGVLPSHLLLADPRAHTTDLMTLRGVRLGVLEELPEEGHLEVTRIKIATAPTITARLIRQDNVTFANQCALFISTNYRLSVRETDHGTWRRLVALPFPYTFRKAHQPIRDANDRRGDGALRDRIRTDPDGSRARAMLAWLAQGAARWYAAGGVMGQMPSRVESETDEWRRESDLLFAIIEDHLEFDGSAHVMATDLLGVVNGWLRAHGHRDWSDRLLAARMEVHEEIRAHRVAKKRARPGGTDGHLSRPEGYLSAPSAHYMAWTGIRFRTAADGAQVPAGQVRADDKTAGRAGCAGSDTNLREAGQITGFMQHPAHPAQAQSNGQVPGLYRQAEWQRMWEMADHAV